jgi:hypothetical protein
MGKKTSFSSRLKEDAHVSWKASWCHGCSYLQPARPTPRYLRKQQAADLYHHPTSSSHMCPMEGTSSSWCLSFLNCKMGATWMWHPGGGECCEGPRNKSRCHRWYRAGSCQVTVWDSCRQSIETTGSAQRTGTPAPSGGREVFVQETGRSSTSGDQPWVWLSRETLRWTHSLPGHTLTSMWLDLELETQMVQQGECQGQGHRPWATGQASGHLATCPDCYALAGLRQLVHTTFLSFFWHGHTAP